MIKDSAFEQDRDGGVFYSQTMNEHSISQGDLKDLLPVTSQSKSLSFKGDHEEATSSQTETRH